MLKKYAIKTDRLNDEKTEKKIEHDQFQKTNYETLTISPAQDVLLVRNIENFPGSGYAPCMKH